MANTKKNNSKKKNISNNNKKNNIELPKKKNEVSKSNPKKTSSKKVTSNPKKQVKTNTSKKTTKKSTNATKPKEVKNVQLPKKKVEVISSNTKTKKVNNIKVELPKITEEATSSNKTKIQLLNIKEELINVIKNIKIKLQKLINKENIINYLNRFNRHKLIKISIICLILALLLIIPYGTRIYKSEASGKFLDIPRFSKLSEECCNYSATFKSLRSANSIRAELKKIVSKYEVLDCDGTSYYYNKDEDYTIIDYGVKRGLFFNTFYITYGSGNSCEIDANFKNLDLLADDYSLADAKKDGSYIILEDEIINESSYDEFLENVSKNNPSTLRIVTTTTDGALIITDLDYLSDGTYKVTYDDTRDPNTKNQNSIIAYKYQHLGIYKEKLYAYNGTKITKSMLNTSDVYYLFDVSN
jgi:hypothetical protein